MSTKNKDNPEAKPIKVNKWDGSAVKNALDDAVTAVLTKKFNYVESFALMDGRLIMCGLSVGVAMFALLWDWLYPFPQSRPVLIVCVNLYFILMGLLTLYTTYKEKGIFVVSIQKDPVSFEPDNVWEASSYLKKHIVLFASTMKDLQLWVKELADMKVKGIDGATLISLKACLLQSVCEYDDKYNLVLTCRDGKTGTVREATMVKSVANFFDENGVLIFDLLEPEVTRLHNSLLLERKDK